MTTSKIITAVTNDLRTAIEKSDNAYGLEYYASSEFSRKQLVLKNIKEFYLVDETFGDTTKIEVYYISVFKNKANGKYRILHKFSWTSCLHSGGAGLCSIVNPATGAIKVASGMEAKKTVEAGDHILIGPRKYERDQFRGHNYFWTL